MSDGAFPDRLSQLKARWESDPASRIFLQLAEEYRHQGRMRDALAVLDRGLKEHPGYLSALVAKGRCHLELGEAEPARTVLERVVKQDATQMVANKLLVRACLETGDAARARERLDLYALLNDSDPEIGDLRRQIRQMERSDQRLVSDESPFDLAPPSRPAPSPSLEDDDIFGLGIGAGRGTAAPPPRLEANDVFELDLAPPAAPMASVAMAPASAPPEPFPERFPDEVRDEVPGAAVAPLDETAADDGDLFPELRSGGRRQRYLSALSAEGIFDLGTEPSPALAPPAAPLAQPPATPQEIPATAAEAPVDLSWLAEQPAALDTPVFEFVETAPATPPAIIPEPFAPAPAREPGDLWLEEAPAAPFASAAEEKKDAAAGLPAPEPAWALEETETWVPPPAAPEPPAFVPAPGPPLAFVPAAPAPPAPSGATATLGELYLRQGHTEEAERIFREVLDRDPDHAAARAGLARIEDDRRAAAAPAPEPAPEPIAEPEPILAAAPSRPAAPPLDAQQLLAGVPAGGGITARKVHLLNRYLDRLRQGSRRDVS